VANKLKQQNREIRAEIASRLARDIQRRNPGWTVQQVNDLAFKQADLQIKRGEVRVS
jgi:ribose 1,5-bisphosphokinase PhnN